MNYKLIPCTPSDERQESMVQIRWLQHRSGSGSPQDGEPNEEKLEQLLKLTEETDLLYKPPTS
jgi:hypothetical protein